MDDRIRALLKGVANGSVSEEQAFELLKDMPFEDLAHTKLDHHRELRKGIQEVIFGEGKSIGQIRDVIGRRTGYPGHARGGNDPEGGLS